MSGDTGGRSAGTFLLLLALSAVCVLLGGLPILAALGAVETEGGIEPIGRVVAFLFGAVFVALGGAVMARPLRALARADGAETWSATWRLAGRRLVRRADPRSAGAALSVAALAAGCWMAYAGVALPWVGGADTFIGLVALEALVIHGFPFFLITVTFVRHTRAAARVVSATVLALLVIAYSVLAVVYGGGIEGLLWLGYLLIPNVLAVLRTDAGTATRVAAISRWAIKFALLFTLAGIVGGGSFDSPETLRLGATYFGALALVELFRITDVPSDLAAAWRELPPGDDSLLAAVLGRS